MFPDFVNPDARDEWIAPRRDMSKPADAHAQEPGRYGVARQPSNLGARADGAKPTPMPEGTVQDIVGHERSTLTGSTYSGKSTLEMRREALAKLAY